MSSRLLPLRAALSTAPLQQRGAMLTFAHKSFRDFFCALRHPSLHPQPITKDVAVLQFAAEMVELDVTCAYVRGLSQGGAAEGARGYGTQAVDGLLAARNQTGQPYDEERTTAAANCASVLCCAGVSLVDLDLRGLQLCAPEFADADHPDAAPPAPRAVPFADFGAANLCGSNLSGASLRGCRLQQAMLDGASLRDADLRDTAFGELPAVFLVSKLNAGEVNYGTCVAACGDLIYVGDGRTLRVYDAKTQHVSRRRR